MAQGFYKGPFKIATDDITESNILPHVQVNRIIRRKIIPGNLNLHYQL